MDMEENSSGTTTNISDLLRDIVEDVADLEIFLEDDNPAYLMDEERMMIEGLVNGLAFALHNINERTTND